MDVVVVDIQTLSFFISNKFLTKQLLIRDKKVNFNNGWSQLGKYYNVTIVVSRLVNVDAVDSVVALLHHVHAPPGEAVRPLGQAHHQHRPAEVDEREGLDRDGSARDGIDQLRGHILVKSVRSGIQSPTLQILPLILPRNHLLCRHEPPSNRIKRGSWLPSA